MNKEEIKNHIVNWLNDYLIQSKTKGFVIGVSGGIDSAVTSTLGALTGAPLLCVEMPIHQEQSQVDRALNHISFLKDNFKNVSSISTNLTPTFDSFTQAILHIDELIDEEQKHLALANVRARLRMTTLYYHAQINNYLVLGTGNKVEDFGIGFFTKYGDGGVDLSPIADLVKSEVYELGEHLGIIKSILTAPPTDGLWGDDRTDEDQIGASYDELEWAMETVEQGIIDFTKLSPRQQEVFQIYTRLNTINQHKMIPIPFCKVPNEFK